MPTPARVGRDSNNYRHGHCVGDHVSQEYRSWHNMIRRCYDSANNRFPLYGARGIRVCDSWRNSFAAFLKDIGPCPGPTYSLDRWPNQNGHYEPGNVRWATRIDQARNKRNNRLLTVNGATKCVAAWAAETGIDARLIITRLRRGWTESDAVTVTSVGNQPKREGARHGNQHTRRAQN